MLHLFKKPPPWQSSIYFYSLLTADHSSGYRVLSGTIISVSVHGVHECVFTVSCVSAHMMYMCNMLLCVSVYGSYVCMYMYSCILHDNT
jgi:hypothetical protein